jgi:S1-C subfamily serine protease
MAAGVITLVVMGLVALVPAVAHRLSAPSSPSPTPSPSASAPPQAILLPDELDKALEGVMTITDGQTFGTAFLIDAKGDFVTASSVIDGASSLRLIDNTGGSHQVRVLGLDRAHGIALARASTDGTPLTIGDSSVVKQNDPVVLLASPKVQNLEASNPATISGLSSTQWSVRVDSLPGNTGGPIVGPGAKVLAVLIEQGIAVPVSLLQADLASWAAANGTLVPLAPFPSALILRGSDTTTTPTSGATLLAVNPSRASSALATIATIQGSGFVSGSALAVHFIPLTGSRGGFSGQGAAVINPSTLTVKVPGGQLVQDYVIELINGDGTPIASRIAFTVTP